ncbi:hypothetical protein [Citrobacter sp. TSA-1]|uniref:hypothetical protein n=1 Tax=Citrobacter sp. TSA-1 TaxID=184912 RepID=UPI000BAE4F7A|nr:hypothetical protein [Citrobacter sp. TSA-1]PAX78143.1 hypothetical protein CIK43_19125 [Citrobacter sp. TSA-1]QKE19517.1 hypothetical protein HF677_007480 [Citrobacter sp. TSA-1]
MEKLKYSVALMGHIIRAATEFYYRPFSKTWDAYLQRILNEGVLESVDDNTAIFLHNGDVHEIWILNRWFAYGNQCSLNGQYIDPVVGPHPGFRTMYRLYQAIQEHQAREAHQ